jgi:hypothetical protein
LLSIHRRWLRPTCSPSRHSDPLHRRLRRLCYHHRRSDCYRVERTSSRAGLSPAVDQRVFTAHSKLPLGSSIVTMVDGLPIAPAKGPDLRLPNEFFPSAFPSRVQDACGPHGSKAPQVGFSATIWKINSRTSFGVRLLPTCVRTLEISLQYVRKPARCQRTTVSGVTTMRDCFHPDQNRRTPTRLPLNCVTRPDCSTPTPSKSVIID